MKSYKIKVPQSYYGTINVTPGPIDSSNYIYVPYKMICTKTTVSDENGTRTVWQIGYWMRFKLFVYGLFHKRRKL